MKKNLLKWALLPSLGLLAMACGGGDDEGEPAGPAAIALYAPDDLEDIELNYSNQSKNLAFEWQTSAETEYTLVMSLAQNLTNPEEVALGTSGTKNLTHAQLDEILGDLGVKPYRQGEVYWAVKGVSAAGTAYSSTRSMLLFRFYGPLTDARDNEVYRVCRTTDELSGDYAVWMADNMRATKYSDGTALVDVTDYYKFPTTGGTAAENTLNTLRGCIYAWPAVVRDMTAAAEGPVQGICPAGWHVATKTDWEFLINTQPDNTQPTASLKDPAYWPAVDGKAAITNFTKFNLVPSGHAWMPFSGIYSEDSYAFFWSGTPGTAANTAHSYAPRSTDHEIEQWPYPYTTGDAKGMAVRCVLDE